MNYVAIFDLPLPWNTSLFECINRGCVSKNGFSTAPASHILKTVANTYSQIYVHIVFAVEARQNLIPSEHNEELQKYMAGIVSGQRHKLIAINNMPDHLHMLLGVRPDASLSDLVRDIKAGSSKFINARRWVLGRFSWQEGFGAFSLTNRRGSSVHQ